MTGALRRFAYAFLLATISYGLAGVNFYLIARYDKEASDRSGDLAMARAEYEAEESLVERMEKAGGLATALRAAFIPKGDLVPFLESFEVRARQHGLIPEVVAANDAAGTAERPEITATISVTGSREAVNQYVREIKMLPYHVVVRSVSLSAADEGEWVSTVSLSAFVLPDAVVREVVSSKK
jgi:hypothetical protein